MKLSDIFEYNTIDKSLEVNKYTDQNASSDNESGTPIVKDIEAKLSELNDDIEDSKDKNTQEGENYDKMNNKISEIDDIIVNLNNLFK